MKATMRKIEVILVVEENQQKRKQGLKAEGNETATSFHALKIEN